MRKERALVQAVTLAALVLVACPAMDPGSFTQLMSSFFPRQGARSVSGRNSKPRELPHEAVAILKRWLFSPEHFHNPYPTHEETAELAQRTGLKRIQIKNWFVNARRRCWKRARASQQSGFGPRAANAPGFVSYARHEGLGGIVDASGVFAAAPGGNGHGSDSAASPMRQAMAPGYGSASLPLLSTGGFDPQQLQSCAYSSTQQHVAHSANGQSDAFLRSGGSGGGGGGGLPLAPKFVPGVHPFTMPMGPGLLPVPGSALLHKLPKPRDGKVTGITNVPNGASVDANGALKRARNAGQPSWARYTPVEDRVLLEWAKAHHWKSPKGVLLWKDLSQKWSSVASNLPQRPWQSLRDRYLRLTHERQKNKGGVPGEAGDDGDDVDGGDERLASSVPADAPQTGLAGSLAQNVAWPNAGSMPALQSLPSHPGMSMTPGVQRAGGIAVGVDGSCYHGAGEPLLLPGGVLSRPVSCGICESLDPLDPVDAVLTPCNHIVHVRCFFHRNPDFVRRSKQLDEVQQHPDGEHGEDLGPFPSPKCPICFREVLDAEPVRIEVPKETSPPPGTGILSAISRLAKIDATVDVSKHPFLKAVPQGFSESCHLEGLHTAQADEFLRFKHDALDLWRVRLVKKACVEALQGEENRVFAEMDRLPADRASAFKEIKEHFGRRFTEIDGQAKLVGKMNRKRAKPEPPGNHGAGKGDGEAGSNKPLSSTDSISTNGTDGSEEGPHQSLEFFEDDALGFVNPGQIERALEVYAALVDLYCTTILEVRQIRAEGESVVAGGGVCAPLWRY